MAPALAELAESLKAAASSWALSTEGPHRPYSRMVNEIPGVEIQRALWLVEGLQVLTGRPVVARSGSASAPWSTVCWLPRALSGDWLTSSCRSVAVAVA